MFINVALLIVYLGSVVPHDVLDFYYRFPKKCIDFTNHTNINLLPKKPHCGKTTVYSPMKNIIGTHKPVLSNEFPWLVDLEVQQKRSRGSCAEELCVIPQWQELRACTGALISNRYVISTASCLKLKYWGDLIYDRRVLARFETIRRVNHGLHCKYDICKPEKRIITIEEIIEHAGLTPVNHNDISLLRLSYAVTFTDSLQPICLPLLCHLQRREVECYDLTVAAWGINESDIEPAPTFLVPLCPSEYRRKIIRKPGDFNKDFARKIRVEIMLELYCDEHTGLPQVMTKQLCAKGMPHKFTCANDSGGPLMIEEFVRGQRTWYLQGLVNYGRDCGEHAKNYKKYAPPTVFTEVRYYVQWILDNIRP